jgi:phage-related minor tail protein
MSDAVELAVAYVSLVPSAKGIAAGVAAELGGVEQAAEQSANKSSGIFATAFSKAGALAGPAIGAGVVAAGAALYKIGADFDDAFDHIRTTTGATGERLNSLQGSFKNVFASVPTDMGSASEAIATVNQKLGLTGKPLEDVSKQLLELSRLTGTDLKANVAGVSGTFVNWGVSTQDQGKRLDELFRASQATGVSVGDLSSVMGKSGSVLRQAGFDFDSSAALLGLLSKAGVDAAAVMPALSRSVASAAKEGKSASDVFQSTFTAIRNAPTDTAAAGAAIDVFGAKAGPNLAGLIRQGKLSYEDLAKTIAGGSDTILGAAADTNDLHEKFQILMNKSLVAIEPIATRVFSAMSTGIDFVTEHMNIFGPVLIGVAAIVAGLLVAAFVAWAVSAAAAAIATITAAAPVIAIGLAIAALAAGIIYAYTHFDIFRAAVNAVADVIKTYFMVYVDAARLIIGGLIDYVKLIVRVVTDVVQGIQAIFRGDWKTAWDKFSDIPVAVIEFVKGRLDAFVGFFTGIGGRISKLTAGMFDGIKEAFRAAINFVISRWNSLEFSIPGVDTHIPGVGKIGGFVLGVPDIPLLAKGGVATSATLAVVGENGPEAIVPLSDAGIGGGNMFVVNVNAGVGDPVEIGRQVVRAIKSWESVAGTVFAKP